MFFHNSYLFVAMTPNGAYLSQWLRNANLAPENGQRHSTIIIGATMTAIKISRIPIFPWGLVNAHLIESEHGCILVDAGLPGYEHKFEEALAIRGLSFRDVKLIIITHAHVDHAGGAARLRELTRAPVLAHEGDLEYFNRRVPMTFCPTGWFGRLFLKTGLMIEPYIGFEPDILLSNEEAVDLGKYGIPGVVKHTPGHTAGSISVELSTKEALVGDLISSGILLGGIVRTGRAKRPPFEDDPQVVSSELQRMVNAGMERFYMGHGGPLDASEVRRHAQTLVAMAR
jgi:glyoxylase-like metal-dependent hydrolase (beta-lactamase superfamily II)